MVYYLKYIGTDVLKFDTVKESVSVLNPHLLPYSIANMSVSYDMVHKFCSDRILMMNRKHCKEILDSCSLNAKSSIDICLFCKGLSLRDNYWICREGSKDTWDTVNLYNNNFSTELSHTALTGNTSKVFTDNNFLTGELTNKGTRAKCFSRENDHLFLIKNETMEEIKSEILTFYLASALGLACSEYKYKKINNLDCSVCPIYTSTEFELIHCRDVMSYYNEDKLNFNSQTYKFFYNIGRLDFLKMQLLDYIVLNTDRNRDNYALRKRNGSFIGLYPIFDHDSCFKGKSVKAIYFPSGKTFEDTLNLIKENYKDAMIVIKPCIENLKVYLTAESVKNVFLMYKPLEVYESVMKRIDNILK